MMSGAVTTEADAGPSNFDLLAARLAEMKDADPADAGTFMNIVEYWAIKDARDAKTVDHRPTVTLFEGGIPRTLWFSSCRRCMESAGRGRRD